MQTSTARTAAPIVVPAPTTAPAATAGTPSNQAVQDAAGLSAGPPPTGGNLSETLALMGPTGSVVLDALPLEQAFRLALPIFSDPWVRGWVAGISQADFSALPALLQRSIVEAFLPVGAALTLRAEAELLVGLGAWVAGEVTIGRPSEIWTLCFAGSFRGAAEVGMGGSVEALVVQGKADMKGRIEGGPTGEAEWNIDQAAFSHISWQVLRAALAGEPVKLEGLVALTHRPPDRAELSANWKLGASAGAGAAVGSELENEGFAAVGLDSIGGLSDSLAGADPLAPVPKVVLDVLRGVGLDVNVGASVAAGYDPEPYFRAKIEGSGHARAFGAAASSIMGTDIKGYLWEEDGGYCLGHGTITRTVSDNGERTSTVAQFAGPDDLAAQIGTDNGEANTQDVGELLLEHEHQVEDVERLEKEVGAIERGLDVPIFENAGTITTKVRVRVASDTSEAFPGVQPANEEEARDMQRALGGLVTGHAYFGNREVRASGVFDAVTLEAASVKAEWNHQLAVGADVKVGAAFEAKGAAGVGYTTTTDVTDKVELEEVKTLLTA